MSKDYLTGKTAAEDLAINPAGWYADHGVELLLDTHATRLDTARAALTLGGGRDLHYDALLLATGGRPRQLPDLASDRVLYLRGISDAQRLAQQLSTGERVVVLGGGFIGCEVAACQDVIRVRRQAHGMADWITTKTTEITVQVHPADQPPRDHATDAGEASNRRKEPLR